MAAQPGNGQTKAGLLIVDDEESVRRRLQRIFEAADYRVVSAADAPTALRLLHKEHCDLVLLDVEMPDVSGLALCRLLRAQTNTRQLPLIVLSASDDEQNKVEAFAAGADDYIVKPFSVKEVVARVRAVLRRADEGSIQRYSDEKLSIDFADIRVTCQGESVKLTRKEFALLEALSKSIGRVVTRQNLLDNVWGYTDFGDTRPLDVHIRRLRQKLGECGDCIETVVGIGYRFVGAK